MLRLLLDIGNTRLKWAIALSTKIVERGAVTTHLSSIPSALEEISEQVRRLNLGALDSAIVCSVGPSDVLERLIAQTNQQFGFDPSVIDVTRSACGVVNQYDDISSLGVDRWVAIIGARQSQGSHATVVVDAGTAITVDYLSTDHLYLGGVIFPGDRLLQEALVSNTAKIKALPITVESVFGRTTSACVSAGVQYGLVGAVAGVLQQMLHEYPLTTKVLVGGGSGPALIGRLRDLCHNLPIEIVADPDIVFSGLIALSESAE